MSTGWFVTLDGPGGVGKSTTLTALTDLLRHRGVPTHATTEPSGSDLGRFTRSHADQIRGHALACLVAADRYHHVTAEVRPHLSHGETVICDRYLASSLVLQQLDGVPERFLLDLNTAVLLPDLAVVLTGEPETIRRRLAERGAHHRFERDPHALTREIALYRDAEATLRTLGVPVLTVDTTTATPSVTAERIASAVQAGRDTVTTAADHVPHAPQTDRSTADGSDLGHRR